MNEQSEIPNELISHVTGDPPQTGIIPNTNYARPLAGTIIGIVLFVIAAISLFYLVWYCENVFLTTDSETWILPVALLIFAIGEIVMGVGLMKKFLWARKATIIWLICTTIPVIGVTVFLFIANNSSTGNDDADARMIAEMLYHVSFIVSLLSMIINGLMIFFLTRAKVVSAYDGKS